MVRRKASFQLTPPTKVVFFPCLAAIVYGTAGLFISLPFHTYALAIGGCVLALACVLKGI